MLIVPSLNFYKHIILWNITFTPESFLMPLPSHTFTFETGTWKLLWKKKKATTLRINETKQLLYNAKCNMYIPNVLYFSGNLFTNFTIWSKISPVPILICFT